MLGLAGERNTTLIGPLIECQSRYHEGRSIGEMLFSSKSKLTRVHRISSYVRPSSSSRLYQASVALSAPSSFTFEPTNPPPQTLYRI